GDGHLKSYEYTTRGRIDRVNAFRLALTDCQALLRAQDYLLDFGVATQEFRFLAANERHREMNAIRTSSRWCFEAIKRLIQWPSEPSLDWSKGFLAGIFDGEGSFSQTVWRICNTDTELIGWTGDCLRALGFRFVVEQEPHTDRKSIERVRLVGGLREHLRF